MDTRPDVVALQATTWPAQEVAARHSSTHELRTPLAALRLELEEALLHPRHADAHHTLAQALRSLDRLETAVINLIPPV